MTATELAVERALRDLALRQRYVNSRDLAKEACVKAGLAQENGHSWRAAGNYAGMVAGYLDRRRQGSDAGRRPRSQSNYLSEQQKADIYRVASAAAFRFMHLLRLTGGPVGTNIEGATILKLIELPEAPASRAPRERLSDLAAA